MASIQAHSGVLGHRLAAHLLRRCTYCPTKTQIDLYAAKTVSQAVADLMVVPNLSLDEPIDHNATPPQKWVNSGADPTSGEFALRINVGSWWVHEALQDPSISHKMEFFLHSNWVISSQLTISRMFYDYLALLRFSALGNLKELAKKMTIDNSMLRYLDNDSNTAANPNENYAREFFELFTIGKGPQIGPGNYTHYTEDDIVQAAKVLTGWNDTQRPLGGDPNYWDNETNLQRGNPRFNKHDTTDKTFSSAFDHAVITGATDAADMFRELSDFVEMVFAKEETAKAYCRKLYRYFVSRTITQEIEDDIITPLATTLMDNDYEVSTVLVQLLESQHFYDLDDSDSGDEVIGAILKSPLELYTHSASFFNLTLPDPEATPASHYQDWYRRVVINVFFTMGGFSIFTPESVAGYAAYYQAPDYSRNWFSGSTLIARYKIPEVYLTGKRVLAGGNTGGVQLDIVDFVKNSNMFSDASDAIALVQELTSYLLPEAPTSDRFDYFLNEVFLDNLSILDWYYSWNGYLTTNDPTAVRIPLETLFTTLLSSQEFQCM